jgi:hypothetical protein
LTELYKVYGADLFQTTSIIKNFREGKADITNYKRKFPFAAYFGHHLCAEMLKNIEGKPVLVTFLRDPFERLLSHFKYVNRMRNSLGKETIELDDFLNEASSMCDFLVYRFSALMDPNIKDQDPQWLKAVSILEKFDYIGNSNNLVEFSDYAAEKFNISLHLDRRVNAAPEIDYKILPDNNLDFNKTIFLKISDDIFLYFCFKNVR